jgi:cation diffusion facilitator family transporter
MSDARPLMRLVIAIGVGLAAVKVLGGILGDSWALVADGIESCADLVGSIVVWGGLRWAAQPADAGHPYGHGRAETLAGLVVALVLAATAVGIAVQSVAGISTPHALPAPWTLAVLIGVIGVKETLFRALARRARAQGSMALLAEAWHQRSDALTSLAALLGIAVALAGGPAWAAADDWAALFASGLILVTASKLLRQGLDELMDAAPSPQLLAEIRRIGSEEPGVTRIEKCRARKAGTGLHIDIHVQVPGALSVSEGHRLGHAVQRRLLASRLPVAEVIVHVEPDPSPG